MDRTVGPYRLGDSLGMTPFGELVTASHAARSEPLAVLLLDDRLAKDHRFRGLLRLEIARAGGLRHPSIARAVEVGEHSGALYVVFERPAESVTLARAFANGDPTVREQTSKLIGQLAAGLDAAHGRRLAHGALGPTSVLVGPSGSAALVGIGLAGAVEEAGLSDVVAERIEAAFVAPEQRTGKRAVASADGYALWVLAGALLRVQPPPAGPADPVGVVLGRQHSADPGARYPSCVGFATALAEVLAPSPGRADAPAEPATRPVTATPRPADAPAPTLSSGPSPTPTTVSAPEQIAAEPAPRPASVPAAHGAPAPSLDVPAPSPIPTSAPPTPTPPFDPAPVDAVPPGDLASWFQRVIDPPVQQGSGPRQGQPQTERAGARPPTTAPQPAWVAAEIPPSDASATRSAPTDAMRAVLQSSGPRDYIGEGIALLGDRVQSLGEIVERFAPNGRVGRAPLGVAVTGALAALLLLGGQAWPATVLVMVLVVLYGVPWLSAKLTASERVKPEAVRVRGTAQLRRTSSTLGTIPELVLMNGDITLSLRDGEYAALSRAGQPQTVERPIYPHGGVEQVVVSYLLPDALVTVLEPSRTLLDVRMPDRSVVLRRPPYAGEPGDVIWTQSDAPLRDDARLVGAPEAESAFDAGAPAAPHRPGAAVTLPLPPAVAERLKAAATTAQRTAIVFGGVAFVAYLTITYLVPNLGFFMLVGAIALAVNLGGSTFARGLRLWNARAATSMLRVVGPVVVSRYRSGKTRRHEVRLYDGTVIKLDRATHSRLSSDAVVRVEPATWSFDSHRRTANGFLESEHEIPAATAHYEPTGPLLLEVRNSFDAVIYRDPVVSDGDLAG